jgi:hypothetical protein
MAGWLDGWLVLRVRNEDRKREEERACPRTQCQPGDPLYVHITEGHRRGLRGSSWIRSGGYWVVWWRRQSNVYTVQYGWTNSACSVRVSPVRRPCYWYG